MAEFKRNEIQEALDNAIKDVMRNEYQLLKDKCSERAIVHWLANYFLRRIEESDFAKAHPDFLLKRDYERENLVVADSDSRLGYTVDVEYNRMGDKGESKRIFHKYCAQNRSCIYKKSAYRKCPKMIECDTLDFQLKMENESNSDECKFRRQSHICTDF